MKHKLIKLYNFVYNFCVIKYYNLKKICIFLLLRFKKFYELFRQPDSNKYYNIIEEYLDVIIAQLSLFYTIIVYKYFFIWLCLYAPKYLAIWGWIFIIFIIFLFDICRRWIPTLPLSPSCMYYLFNEPVNLTKYEIRKILKYPPTIDLDVWKLILQKENNFDVHAKTYIYNFHTKLDDPGMYNKLTIFEFFSYKRQIVFLKVGYYDNGHYRRIFLKYGYLMNTLVWHIIQRNTNLFLFSERILIIEKFYNWPNFCKKIYIWWLCKRVRGDPDI